jgi:hypothetical protein
MSQSLTDYIKEGQPAGTFHRGSLQQLMDALSGLESTVDLLKATSQALLNLASDTEQVTWNLTAIMFSDTAAFATAGFQDHIHPQPVEGLYLGVPYCLP